MAQEVARVARRVEEAKETKVLDLSKCELLKVPDAVYLMLKNSVMDRCDLSANKMKKIPSKFCTKFPSITELELQENSLNSLPVEIQELEELKVLDISNNKFKSLPSFLYDCPKLSTLTAKYNQITEVDIDRLRKMTCLRELNLQDNPLSSDIQEQLKNIDMFTVHIGDSDPVGKELDELE